MQAFKIRAPAVAGQFYPASSLSLNKEIENLIDRQAKKTDVIACVLPHAGYMYSGKVVGSTVSRINIKNTVILLGPNHTGFGAPFSIMTQGLWQTPLGETEINSPLAQQLLRSSKYLEDDASAHQYEHSLEVELPFLQYFKKNFKIVPIIFLSQDLKILNKIGEEIGNVLKDPGIKDSVTLIASSDMTHYEPQQEAERKDKEAIAAILKLDIGMLMDKVKSLNISMCGYAPVIVMISIAKILGAKTADLIKYQTSGDVTGDKSSVVGYAGITIQ